MLSYIESHKLVETYLEEFDFSRAPNALYDPIHYILSIGGKRIRPCLTLMAHSLYSDTPNESIDAALGIEVFHNFTLLHDDIMDNALVRRNYATVHKKWSDNVAILSGDAMLILAYQLISKSKADNLPKMLDLFNNTALEVCEGQQYDMDFENRNDVTVTEYLEMIRLKTAVLLAGSLAIGAIAGGAIASDIDALYKFGISLGIAFQLQDDYLDVFADPKKFGKSIGGDIIANKKTYLMLSALQCNDKKATDKLNSWLNKKDFEAEKKVAEITAIYKHLHIDKKTKDLTEEYLSNAISSLELVSVSSEKKSKLKALVSQLMKREH